MHLVGNLFERAAPSAPQRQATKHHDRNLSEFVELSCPLAEESMLFIARIAGKSGFRESGWTISCQCRFYYLYWLYLPPLNLHTCTAPHNVIP
jgi:hypothetical protein